MEEVCKESIDIIENIKSIEHCKIDNMLNSYKKFFISVQKKYEEFLKDDSTIENDINNSQNFFEFLEIKWRFVGKFFHMNDYSEIPDKNLIILTILKNFLLNLKDFINLYNLINVTYDNEILEKWLDENKENYDKICGDFNKNIPCLEAHSNHIEHCLEFIKERPDKEITNIIPKEVMEIDDFTNDGQFARRITQGLKPYEIVGLFVSCFRFSLCGTYNSCSEEYIELKKSYNMNNFKVYLDYLNKKYKIYHKYNMPKEDIIKILESSGINISEQDISGKMCCKKDIISFEGGKIKKYKSKKYKSRKSRKNKTKKYKSRKSRKNKTKKYKSKKRY